MASNTDVKHCSRCLSDIFPFNGISSDREFKEAINGFSIDRRHLDKTVRKVLTDLNQTIGGCKYYDEDQFTKMLRTFFTKIWKESGFTTTGPLAYLVLSLV